MNANKDKQEWKINQSNTFHTLQHKHDPYTPKQLKTELEEEEKEVAERKTWRREEKENIKLKNQTDQLFL